MKKVKKILAAVTAVALTAFSVYGCAAPKQDDEVSFDIDGNYTVARSFSEGKAFIKNSGGKRFIDKSGKTILEITEDNVGDFHEGLCWFVSGKNGGYLNERGEETYFADGFAVATAKDFRGGFASVYIVQAYGVNCFVIKTDGTRAEVFSELINDGEYGAFNEGLAKYRNANFELYGFVKENGEKLCEPEYSEAGDFSCGLARAKKDGKTFFVNSENKKVFSVAAEYMEVGDFSENAVRARNANGWQFLDKNGELLIDDVFEDAGDFSCGVAVVKKDGKIYAVNANGEKVFEAPEGATELNAASEGYLSFVKSGKYGFISMSGKIIKEAQYDYADNVSEGYAACRIGSEWGYDKIGE